MCKSAVSLDPMLFNWLELSGLFTARDAPNCLTFFAPFVSGYMRIGILTCACIRIYVLLHPHVGTCCRMRMAIHSLHPQCFPLLVYDLVKSCKIYINWRSQCFSSQQIQLSQTSNVCVFVSPSPSSVDSDQRFLGRFSSDFSTLVAL